MIRRCLYLFCFACLCFLCRVKPSSSASCGSRVTTAEDGELEEHGDGPDAFVVSVGLRFSEFVVELVDADGTRVSLICLKLNFGLAPVFVPVGLSVSTVTILFPCPCSVVVVSGV